METQTIPAGPITFHNSWKPFRIVSGKGDFIRPLTAKDGVLDRLRLVAFAEVQAKEAFLWGAEKFKGIAPDAWIDEWTRFAAVEERHANMLLTRFHELGGSLEERSLSDKLMRLCMAAEDPVTFLFLLSSAEERGMEAGFTLGKQMELVDGVSAKIFHTIAEEEVEHVHAATAALAPHDPLELKERARAVNARIMA